MLHVNPHLLSVLSGVILPLLVALVTKKHASAGVKAATLTVLAVLTAVAAVLVAGHGAITINKLVDTAGAAFASSVVLYYGIYKPTGWTDVIQTLTHDFGIGTDAITKIMIQNGYIKGANGLWSHPATTAVEHPGTYLGFGTETTTGVVPPNPVEQSEPPVSDPVDPAPASVDPPVAQ